MTKTEYHNYHCKTYTESQSLRDIIPAV